MNYILDNMQSIFDGEKGQSQVKLLITDEEKLSIKFDEDVGCRRYRIFEGVLVNMVDNITIVGEAHWEEKSMLDFIEFIPIKQTNKNNSTMR